MVDRLGLLPGLTASRYIAGARWPIAPLDGAPRASMSRGAPGLAYFLLRYGTLRADSAALDAAAEWAELGVSDPDEAAAFGWPVVAPHLATARASLMFHRPGAWCVQALVSEAVREDPTSAVHGFVAAADAADDEAWDATMGTASLLEGCATLLEALTDEALAERVREAGDRLATMAGLRAESWSQHGVTPGEQLGIAHGPAGVAHALLRWTRITGTEPAACLPALLEVLEKAATPSGSWPVFAGQRVVWRGWCNGGAGWALLWTLAAQVTGEQRFLVLAERAASLAVEIGADQQIADLCCGRAGAAYAALAMHRTTGDTGWLDRARRLAEAAALPTEGQYPQDHSLLKGEVGLALLVLELEQPARPGFPLFEPVA